MNMTHYEQSIQALVRTCQAHGLVGTCQAIMIMIHCDIPERSDIIIIIITGPERGGVNKTNRHALYLEARSDRDHGRVVVR